MTSRHPLNIEVHADDAGINATLTNGHAASHGLPVLVIAGQAYSANDLFDGRVVGEIELFEIGPVSPVERQKAEAAGFWLAVPGHEADD